MKCGTHDGIFHGDDVFAAAALYMMGLITSLIRTRDSVKLAKCDLRFDVGRKYNPATRDFDHHQEGGAGCRPNGIPYASFGLIWKTFGVRLCDSEEIASIVDYRLVQVIDATDVGFDLYSELNVQNVCPYTLSDMVANFNPPWYDDPIPDCFDTQFMNAVHVAKAIIKNEIILAYGVPEAKEIIARATPADPAGRILIFDQNLPRREILLQDNPNAWFVVLPPENGGNWQLRAVEVSRGTSAVRRKFPESWAGKKGRELIEATGVESAYFCHNTRFIATARTREGAIRLAELAIA